MPASLLPTTLAALLAGTPVVFATRTTRGVVQAYDAMDRTLELEGGGRFQLFRNVGGFGFEVGDTVIVNWELKAGMRIATHVRVVD